MAEFLTTKAIAFHIEEIIKTAKEHICIITPYLKLSNTFYERLYEASGKGLDIDFVYGKTELTKHDKELINSLNINIYFKENLHAKCYMNEESALVTSMNLHSFSEGNNREFGILINRKTDKKAYLGCIDEMKSVLATSFIERLIEPEIHIEEKEYGDIDFLFEWAKYLKKNYKDTKFEIINDKISAESFPQKGIRFSNEYGFMTFTIDSTLIQITDEMKQSINSSLDSSYRVYWNKEYSTGCNRICIYQAKGHKLNSIDEQIGYCAKGLDIFLKNMLN